MIASRELKMHLDALDRQHPAGRGTKERPHASLSASALPQLQQLRARLDQLQSHQTADVEMLVRDLLDSPTIWLENWIGDLARAAAGDPMAVLPLVNFGNTGRAGAQLLAHPLARISLTVLPHDQLIARKQADGARAIIFPGTVSIQRFIRSGDATLSLWQAPRAEDDFTMDGPARCRNVGERRLTDGATLRLDGRYETFSIAAAAGPILVLQAEIFAGCAGLLIEYDAQSLRPIAASSTDDGSSRSQMLLSFLRSCGRRCDHPVLAQFAADERFYVRWHAVCEWLLVDPDGAVPQLRRMSATDPHPDIRETATQIVSYLDSVNHGSAAPCHA